MKLARETIRELLPLAFIAWAAFVVLAGAAHLAHQNERLLTDESAASAGLGLCALTAAAFFGTGAIRPRLSQCHLRACAAVSLPHRGASSTFSRFRVPPPQPPLIQLLQVFRT
ncbi:MAG: hypothetical protein AB1425_04525 [Actinomycetota bacterium]